MVNDTLHAVGKGQGRQGVCAKAKSGVVGITVMYGKVVGAVVAAAGAGQAGNTLFVDGELCSIAAIVRDVTCVIVGNGVAADPVAPCAVTLRENIAQPGVIGIRPLIGGVSGVNTAALAVQQFATVLGIVDQGRPVVAAGKIGAALSRRPRRSAPAARSYPPQRR